MMYFQTNQFKIQTNYLNDQNNNKEFLLIQNYHSCVVNNYKCQLQNVIFPETFNYIQYMNKSRINLILLLAYFEYVCDVM